jgi:hypothetical protein
MTVAFLNKTRKNPSLIVRFCNVVDRSIDYQYSYLMKTNFSLRGTIGCKIGW